MVEPISYLQCDLISIAEKSFTLEERLASVNTGRETGVTDPQAYDMIKKWSSVLDSENEAILEKRLAWDGLDVGKVYAALSRQNRGKGCELPPWMEIIKEAVCIINSDKGGNRGSAGTESCDFLDKNHPIPFEEILKYFVITAKGRLLSLCGEKNNILSDDCFIKLERGLLIVLSNVAGSALEAEFSLYRWEKQSFVEWLSLNPDEGSKTLYTSFVDEMLAEKFIPFFKKYSVLARLICTVVDSWADSCSEFICRLFDDWTEIKDLFEIEEEHCRVEFLAPFLSDFHNKCRSVFCLQFASGRRLIYKPRDIAAEENYFNLLKWINENFPLHFKIVRVLNKITHGWVEFVEHYECNSLKEVEDYYKRAGGILFILHILKGRDFHYENIVACGDQPVIVDLETLFHPDLIDEARDIGHKKGMNPGSPGNCVLRTDFLPQDRFLYYDMNFDISGLGASKELKTDFLLPDWKNTNTDKMKHEYKNHIVRPSHNIPRYGCEGMLPRPYIESIINGFKEMFSFFKSHRDQLLSNEGPIIKFKSQKSRFLFRPTRVYNSILFRILEPQFLKDGLTRSIELELLYRKALKNEKPPLWWGVIKEEQRALEELNIPYFSTFNDSNAISTEYNKIASCLDETGFRMAIAQIENIDEYCLDEQIDIIIRSLS